MKESQSLKKKNKRKKQRRKTLLISLVCGLLLVGVCTVFFKYQVDTAPVNTELTETFEVEIPKGSTATEITQLLKEKQVIRNANALKLYLKKNNAQDIKAGFYQFSSAMTLDEVTNVLQAGGTDHSLKLSKLTIREGEQIRDIAQQIAQVTPYTAEEFISLVNNREFFDQLAKQYPRLLSDASQAKEVRYLLEGYLYPATYEVTKEKSLQDLVTEMVATTDQKLEPYYEKINQNQLNVHEVMTLASLVEREGVSLEDRKAIAGVFLNRIKEHMMLQTDISVLYALGTTKELVTYQDTEVDSPYNLYQHYGYGPGPYNSPSIEAILATLEPTESDYLYFLADTKTGTIYYATTYDEHLTNKEKYMDGE